MQLGFYRPLKHLQSCIFPHGRKGFSEAWIIAKWFSDSPYLAEFHEQRANWKPPKNINVFTKGPILYIVSQIPNYSNLRVGIVYSTQYVQIFWVTFTKIMVRGSIV